MRARANVKLDFEVNLTLNETEVRALDALVGYGYKGFLEAFYEKLGKHYLEPHALGLKSLFDKIEEIRPTLSEMDEVKKAAIKIKEKFNG